MDHDSWHTQAWQKVTLFAIIIRIHKNTHMDQLHANFTAEPEQEATPSPDKSRPSLGKQLLGALVGGTLALGVYYAYEYAKPKVAAYLTLPVAEGGRMYDLGAANIADKSLEDSERKRFASKNMQAAARLQGEQFDHSVMQAVDNHSNDIDWQGHEVEQGEEEADSDAVAVVSDEDPHNFEVLMDGEEGIEAMEQEDAPEQWDDLWEDIGDREEEMEHVERSNAADLPGTGFGLGIVALGAAAGTLAARKRKTEK